MNNNPDNSTCFVFSQATLDLALDEWIRLETAEHPKESENFQITAKAIPWFLKHLAPDSEIFMFTGDDLKAELPLWKDLQLAEYPKQKKRIQKTCDQITHFFNSDILIQYKMIIHV